MFAKLLSGVALAATFTLTQSAFAGHGYARPCPPRAYYSSVPQGGWYHYGPVTTGDYQPAAPPAAAAPPGGPPVASGEGRVIRRFSYEPGTEPAAQAAAPTFQPSVPAYQPAAPVYRSSQPTMTGRSRVGDTVERRLHPGRGWQR